MYTIVSKSMLTWPTISNMRLDPTRDLLLGKYCRVYGIPKVLLNAQKDCD